MTLAIGAHTNADRKMACTVATTLLMVVWYLFECLPMGVTSFLPVVLFPLLGVVPGSRIAMVYFSDQVRPPPKNMAESIARFDESAHEMDLTCHNTNPARCSSSSAPA